MIKYLLTLSLALSLITVSSAQRAGETVTTFRNLVFYTVDQKGFEEYLKLYRQVKAKGSVMVVPALKGMIKELEDFKIDPYDHAYRDWYELYYVEFESFVESCRSGTLTLLQGYLQLIKKDKTKYFHDNFFLYCYFCKTTDYFYKNYWFVGNDRYFSIKFVDRFVERNAEAKNLFELSPFFYSFEKMNALAADYEDELHQILEVGQYGDDIWGYLKEDLVDYTYFYIPPSVASYCLQTFDFNCNTGNPFYDMETSNLMRFLNLAKQEKIYLVAKFKKIDVPSQPNLNTQNH